MEYNSLTHPRDRLSNGGFVKIIGKIYKVAARKSPQEAMTLDESMGCLILADAKIAKQWTGLGLGGRWKTWIVGPLADLPMIQWPRFSRFHQYKHEAEGAYVALEGAIKRALVGAPIVERPFGKSPEAKYGVVYPQDDPQAEGQGIGIIMMDECSDHDFATHTTRRVTCVRAANHDGPRLLSHDPDDAAFATVATVQGINNRIDHIILAASDDPTAFINDFLRDASPEPSHDSVSIDCMSGVLNVFWSRVSGEEMLGQYGDPAADLCRAGLTSAGAMPIPVAIEGIEARVDGPVAYAFLVNPGKWTGRWFHAEDDSSALIFSRDGAESFHPQLDCSMPDVKSAAELGVDSPFDALQGRAKEVAGDAAKDFIDDLIGPYLPASLLQSAKRWGREKLWAVASGCATLALIVLFLGGMLLIGGCFGLVKMVV